MAETLKANKKYQHIYAILRYELDAEQSPIDLRVTVKKVVLDPQFAEAEVKRLNELNKDKGAYYFCQVTRLEDAPIAFQNSHPAEAVGVSSGASTPKRS